MATVWAFVLFFYQVWIVVGQSYPSCSTACISAAAPSTCNSTDSVCICQQVDQSSLLSCLASSCDCADQQTAAATFDSACGSNGVQLTLNVACSAASSSTSSSDTTTTSSSVASATPAIATSTVYSAPAPSTSSSPTQAATQAATTVSSTPPGISTSTAVVVFSGGSGTIITYVTSTHWYTPTPSFSSSSTSSYPINSPTATNVGFTQGSLIHHGLATGAKAGIGAGVGAAVVAVLVFSTWLLWFCRRRRRRTSSVADSERYQHSLAPDVLVATAMEERRRLSELPSETTSRKQAFSWGTSALSDSSHHRAPSSEEVLSHHSVSAESGQHSPPIDLTYQRPVLGNDGYWHQAQELQGEYPGQAPAAPAPATAPDGFQAAMPMYKVQSRPVVPPGKWRPHQVG